MSKPSASPSRLFGLEPSVLFEDTHLIVLDKPAGLLSQGESTGDENVVDWLRRRFGRPYVGLVHRLDRNTSGAIVVAKRTKSAQRLSDALVSGQLTRSYLAWVEGVVERDARWTHWLLKDEARNLVKVVAPPRAGGKASAGAKPAALHARPVRVSALGGHPVTLLELVLETGRSHQIRAQASHERHPLVGDRKYGGRLELPASEHDGSPRPALHSHRIAFPHPMSGELLEFEAPLPADMASVGERGSGN